MTPLINRHDFEILAMGFFSANAMIFYLIKTGAPVGESIIGGISSGSAACAAIYAIGVVARTVPSIAAPMVNFSHLVNEFRREQRSMAVAFRPMEEEALAEEEAPQPDRVAVWRVQLRRFLLAGRLLGMFSRRAFITAEYTSDSGYRTLSGALVGNGVIVSGNGGTGYADGYDYGRAVFEVKTARLTLPPGDAPRVTIGQE